MSCDYSFYTDTYLGNLIPGEEFPRYVRRADARLEELTYGRCFDPGLPESVRTRVSLAECAIADTLYSNDSASGGFAPSAAVTEEKVGSHSVRYADAVSASQALAAQTRGVALEYLLTTGLLNRAATIVD